MAARRLVKLAGIPVYPVALAMAFVLGRYLRTDGYPEIVARSLVVAAAVALVVEGALVLTARRSHLGAFVAAALLMTFADPVAGVVVVAVGSLAVLVAAARERRLVILDWRRATVVLNAVGVSALVANVALSAARLGGGDVEGRPPAAPVASDLPDIYVLLLDSYPRSDTLEQAFEFDNSDFLTAMASIGLSEARDSHSNYNATGLTLASLFAAEQVPSLAAGERGKVTGWVLQRYANGGVGLRWLREAGYAVITIPSGVSEDELLASDQVNDTGGVTSFETSILKAGFLPRLLPGEQARWIYDQQRERLLGAFARLRSLPAEDAGQPRFVFAHVMSPHAPILFTATGDPVDPPPCMPLACDAWDRPPEAGLLAATLDQLRYTNTLVADAVSRIVAGSRRPPVVVILSDHGLRFDPADLDEMFRNLFLSATPGHPGLFPANATPINLIPRLLNAYAGTSHPLASEESYLSDLGMIRDQGYLPLQPWPQR